ncbi:hypothetical protein FACS1894139_19020 [Planctomycetales bacterium]|nr:hypothetical protein FACS1894107_13110 [Planctomycetales bacterium]GHT08942.1 hypothetical protein FACS1894139_19020 [Planctomycetales bacterium]
MDAAANEGEWTQSVPDYEDLCVIGRGVSGLVLRGKSTRFGRDAALKLIAPAAENSAERFFNEARQTARLRHAHIARGFDCGRAGQYFFYAMEFIRGESAASKLRRLQTRRLKEIETLKIVQAAAAAMHYAYQQGLLLIDVKPNNLLLAENGDIKVADFGVAKDLAFATAEQWTQAFAAYAAPETAQGENPDIRSALYALGCVWYELLTGAPPFTAASPSAILVAQINDAPRPPAAIDAKISPATGQLIAWLLNKKREQRPRSAQQFLAKMTTHPLVKIANTDDAPPDSSPKEDADELDESRDRSAVHDEGFVGDSGIV